MKKVLISVIALALALCIVGCSAGGGKTVSVSFLPKNTTDIESVVNEFVTVAENDKLLLQFNEKTTDIAVTDKSNGFVWSSANSLENDETAYNLLYLTYHTDAGNVGTLSSTFNCISNGQYKFETIENGIKVMYSLGDVATEYIYPETLLPDRFDYFYDKTDEDGQALLDIVYTQIDISFYDEVTQKEMNEKYPYAKGGKIYIQRSVLNDSMKSEISALFADLGYTKDDLLKDNTSISSDKAESVAVNVSLYYRLEDDAFTVSMPEEEIQYDSYIHVDSVNVLECFVGQTMENGYFLLPDGSGSVMNFRNKKTAKNYREPIYGTDNAIFAESKLFDLSSALLPVFGCVTGENAYFAVVEDGESHTYINACSGDQTVTPRAWLDFTVEPMDYMIATNNKMTGTDNKTSVYQTDRYDGALKVKYHFMTGEKANYSYMAEYYRNILFGDKRAEVDSYPLMCEIIGAVDLQKTRFGFNYSDIIELTTFKETAEIAEDLIGSDIEGLNLILTGFDGIGIRNGYDGGFSVLDILGGKTGLNDLISSVVGKSVKVFLDCDTQYSSGSGNGKNSARFLDEGRAKLYSYDKATFVNDKSNFMYVISPAVTVKAIKEAAEFVKGYSCGLSVKTVGSNLNSDFNAKNTIDRQDALKMIADELSAESENISIITSAGNAYVLPYTECLTDFPIRSNGNDMTDYSVPFLAMVLSGRVEYSAPALNDGYSEKTDILRMIESGTACSAILTAKDTKSTNMSDFDIPTETCYQDIKNTIISSYKTLKDALSDVYGKTIVSHRVYDSGLREVVYENGTRFYINYGDEPCEINGITVPALDYVKEGI